MEFEVLGGVRAFGFLMPEGFEVFRLWVAS